MGTDTRMIKKGVQMAFQYQQLAQQLAQKIYSGELAAGQRLYALRQFSQQHQISLIPRNAAMNYLKPKASFMSKKSLVILYNPHRKPSKLPCRIILI